MSTGHVILGLSTDLLLNPFIPTLFPSVALLQSGPSGGSKRDSMASIGSQDGDGVFSEPTSASSSAASSAASSPKQLAKNAGNLLQSQPGSCSQGPVCYVYSKSRHA